MHKKVALITVYDYWGDYLSGILHRLFPGKLDIVRYSTDKNPIQAPIQADLALVTEPILHYVAQRFLVSIPHTIDVKFTFQKSQYDILQAVPAGTRLLIFSDSEQSILSAVSEFQSIGLTHLEFVPFISNPIVGQDYPTTAVTLGHGLTLPDFVEREICVGRRVIDLACLTKIAIYLDLEYMMKREPFVKYADELCPEYNTLFRALDRSQAIDRVSFDLLSRLGEGILLVNGLGVIQDCNDTAASLLGGHSALLGQQIGQVLPCPLTQKLDCINEESAPQVLTVNNTPVSLQLFPIHIQGVSSCALALVSSFEEKENRQRNLRRQVLKKGNIARHTFRDIITANAKMASLKATAERQAKSNATVLITGESGTGKEVLAQAIHNASPRKNRPFVAINCSALPRELLGSELFGYEEGAFTGARRGGKSGLFELANSGTIFLDEIGDMALDLQSQILRVLEEREVLRIGGETAYPVDIRIIAATNQNLWEMMEQGRFRRDLYYRLSVIPLELPPLRCRCEDVLLLLEHFKTFLGCSFSLSQEAGDYLQNYPWYGNVRELRNWVEYLAALQLDHLDIDDTRQLLCGKRLSMQSPEPVESDTSRSFVVQSCAIGGQKEHEFLVSFRAEIAGNELHYYLVMHSLANGHGRGIGRNTLLKDARQAGYHLSEVRVRRIIQTLCRYHLALQGSGRMGSRITPLGLAAFESLRKDPWLKNALQVFDGQDSPPT